MSADPMSTLTVPTTDMPALLELACRATDAAGQPRHVREAAERLVVAIRAAEAIPYGYAPAKFHCARCHEPLTGTVEEHQCSR